MAVFDLLFVITPLTTLPAIKGSCIDGFLADLEDDPVVPRHDDRNDKDSCVDDAGDGGDNKDEDVFPTAGMRRPFNWLPIGE